MAARNLSAAGCISAVWNAPAVFSTLACKAPAFSALSRRISMAASVPPHEKPFGKRAFAMEHTPPGPSFFAASAQSFSKTERSSPATESIFCLLARAASCMASPLSFTSFRASSNSKTPAAQSAVYSPSESPAMTWQEVAASSFWPRSFSKPAKPPMNMQGWQCLVSSSLSSGPLRQRSSTSQPKIGLAFSSISLTFGMSFTPSSILTYWDP
mmetsp:Transcript_52018/g.123855  ORF Transcript_52018/g.123855 Transcript_52018/m.123855 type:complete len:212 (-) Transcript_52018:406-1041(-)